jgi:tRNA 2-thiouridine synthesizing protein A
MTDQVRMQPGATGLPVPDATVEMLGTVDALGSVCALLTPAIKARLKDLAPRQVLLVRVDDPSARLDVTAWCALTGHTLLATTEPQPGLLEFLIRKKE